MTKILITGANGQLGSELRNLLDERGVAYDAFDSKQMDITDQAVVNEKISALKPEVIYHCAAYTAVDNAEDVAKDLNWQVNVDGLGFVVFLAGQGAVRVCVDDGLIDGLGDYRAVRDGQGVERLGEGYGDAGSGSAVRRFVRGVIGCPGEQVQARVGWV